MSSELLVKFAGELKATRESKNIPLQQIAFKTKIDIKFLQAIEDAKFDVLPEIYVRAFIKEYASSVELNPKETIAKYDLAKSGATESVAVNKPNIEVAKTVEPIQNEMIAKEEFHSAPITKEFTSPEISQPVKELNNQNAFSSKINIIVGSFILVVAVVISYFAFFYEGTKSIETNNNYSEEQQEPRYEEPKAIDTTSQSNVTPIVMDDSLKLAIENSERVWIKVLSDGKNIHQNSVEKNSKLLFKAEKMFSVSIGNAGVVKMFFNNKPVPNVGKFGEIRNIVLSADTIRYYTVKRNESKSPANN